ncbi:MAG: metal-dependent hydrolase [Usitatibacter sp.]
MVRKKPEISVRQPKVDISRGFARHWHGGDAYRSCLFNTLSMMFPAGEQQFIDVAREFVRDIEAAGDSALQKDVRTFIGQEATHRHMHAQLNQQLAAQGYRNLIEPFIQWRIRMSQHVSRHSRLAVVIAYEHFTAILGDGLLRNREWLEAADEPLATIWRWHAAEETEHKSVAFDVYRFAGGGYWRRILWFMYVSLAFLADSTLQTTASLWRDGALFRLSTLSSALRFWFGRKGLFWHIVPMWLGYFAPGFHPWQHDNRDLLKAWHARYGGDFLAASDNHPLA